MAVPLLGQAREPEAPAEPKVIKARTAFLLFIDENGQANVSDDINLPITVERKPSPDELFGALHVILKNLNAQEAAAATMFNMMMSARAQQEANQNAQIQAALAQAEKEAKRR